MIRSLCWIWFYHDIALGDIHVHVVWIICAISSHTDWFQNMTYTSLATKQNTSYSWLQNAFYPWLQNTSFPITVDFDNDQTKIIQKLSVHIKFAINLCVLTLKLYNVGNDLINCTQRWVIFILLGHGKLMNINQTLIFSMKNKKWLINRLQCKKQLHAL